MEKTTFNATIIVAGTNNTNSAPNTEDIMLPISIPRMAASKTNPWIPAKLTITKDTEA